MTQWTYVAKTIAMLAAILMPVGCSGITPYEAPNYRDNPPVNGVLTGARGEFVFIIQRGAPETASEVEEASDKSGTNVPQTLDGDDKKGF